MNYLISDIAEIIGAQAAIGSDVLIEHLLIDSRKIHNPGSSLFFALKGPRRDGHQFIPELYKKGVRNFVVEQKVDSTLYPGANFLFTDDTLVALQQLVARHRSRFNIPVIGITGSNGKTIVKEWLYQLLHEDYKIVRSPKSFNSQVGVPLSVWMMNEQHTLALFEAGISQQGEMARLERMIRPTIGVLTNIGEAHSEGFNDADHKFREKLVLFRNCGIIIGRETDFTSRKEFLELMADDLQVMTWGSSENNAFVIRRIEKKDKATEITFYHQSQESHITIPFIDDASIENAITCWCVLRILHTDPQRISERMLQLHPVNMRLELKKGINDCIVINDSYSADLSSLRMALDFLDQQNPGIKKTVILSDFLQSAVPDEELYAQIFFDLDKHHVARVIGIGERIGIAAARQEKGTFNIELYSSTENFIRQFRSSRFRDETILVKGARVFAFEQIVQLLEQKIHQTLLEINLNAIAHNLKQYQGLLKPSTKVMAMVKAFAYGSGGAEIAGILQFHRVDCLGVAYTDEGIELRKAGISLPVMVMNPEPGAFEAIVEHNLEPEIFSFELLQAFDMFLKQEGLEQYPVHIEIETGMNRLGFAISDMDKLADALSAGACKVQSVFSHLAASEDPAQDAFTQEQFHAFEKAAAELQEKLGYSFDRHIANSAAVVRHPYLQMDMVRLGIGLYGVDNSGANKVSLQTVATLRSNIAQLKKIKAGESVSYNRKGVVDRDSVIATIRIGYADGYPRRLGNGVGKISVKGQMAPVIGTVCMDMTMIDVTGISGVQEGDEVIIFGKELPVQQVADWGGTIPYEIMTGISQRVKRVYFEE